MHGREGGEHRAEQDHHPVEARQQELLAAEVAASDVVITTAQIPGRQAPVLVTTAMVDGMSEGAVIVDMAADSGGNCELTVAGEDVVHHGVTVVGLTNPASLSAGGFFSLALMSNSTVMAWGQNNYGQCGNGSNTDCWVPVPVLGLTKDRSCPPRPLW